MRVLAAWLLLQIAGRIVKDSENVIKATMDAKPTGEIVSWPDPTDEPLRAVGE